MLETNTSKALGELLAATEMHFAIWYLMNDFVSFLVVELMNEKLSIDLESHEIVLEPLSMR
jgi:hypothetical protein